LLSGDQLADADTERPRQLQDDTQRRVRCVRGAFQLRDVALREARALRDLCLCQAARGTQALQVDADVRHGVDDIPTGISRQVRGDAAGRALDDLAAMYRSMPCSEN